MNEAAAPQQLTLLATPAVNARFQLSRETRERGLRHVAEIRRMLAERQAEQTAGLAGPRRDRAA